MSGAHSQYRTPSTPLIIDGQTVTKLDNRGRPVKVYKLLPGGTYENGRCVDYQVFETFAVVHVLDYSPAYHRPSKHAAGRTRPRSGKEQRAFRNRTARLAQIRKTITVDTNRLAAEYAGVTA